MSNVVSQNHDNSHGSVKSYIIGFIISIILTIIPYYVVVNHAISTDATYIVIAIAALLQLLVQLIFFLHLGTGTDKEWNTLAFVFTLFVVLILVIGSLWIMYNLDYNMMEHM